jgi:dienelactone hydrolase
MLAEQAAGLSYLAQHPAVDPTRIATLGISMGGTLAWWLAAMDTRVAAVVSLCCFADMGELIHSGTHDGHGIYMTVPGLLPIARTGKVAGLTAPRPQFFGIGLQDWSTPEPAFKIAQTDIENAYSDVSAEANLAFHIEAKFGHKETPAMRAAVLEFLSRHL